MKDKAEEVQKVRLKPAATPLSVVWSLAALASGVSLGNQRGQAAPQAAPEPSSRGLPAAGLRTGQPPGRWGGGHASTRRVRL